MAALALFKALLIAVWHDLSDVKLRGFGGSSLVPAVLRIFHDRGDARSALLSCGFSKQLLACSLPRAIQ